MSLKQETVSGSGISWAVCLSAPRSRQMTTLAPHHSVFTGRMPFLPPNQQRQSTEGKDNWIKMCHFAWLWTRKRRVKWYWKFSVVGEILPKIFRGILSAAPCRLVAGHYNFRASSPYSAQCCWRSKHWKLLTSLKMTTSFAICLFPVVNGALFLRKKLCFSSVGLVGLVYGYG